MVPGPRELLANFGRGALMGGADIVPGVSGGTVALIVGIYERLIASIRMAAAAPAAAARADLAQARQRLGAVEWALIAPLGAGIALAIAAGAAVLPPLLERHPAQMHALFFGLVAASLPIPWRRIARVTWRGGVAAGVTGAAAFLLVGIPPAQIGDPSMAQVFAAAAVAICAMILPGVSGAFLLKAMGLYETTLGALRSADAVYVGVFILGAAVGLGAFSRLLAWLLERRHDVTMAALVGLMAGSLRALWPWQDADRALRAPAADQTLPGVIALAALGFLAVSVLRRWEASRQNPAAPPAGQPARRSGDAD